MEPGSQGDPARGDPSFRSDDLAEEELFATVYATLCERARMLMMRQPPEHTLQATALVNEVYLKLRRKPEEHWKDEKHLLLTAARAMRQILVDHSRHRHSIKGSGGRERHPLDGIVVAYEDTSHDLDALNAALEDLAEFSPDMARVVELRYFAGRSMDDIAALMGMTKRTLERRWQATRAWLNTNLS